MTGDQITQEITEWISTLSDMKPRIDVRTAVPLLVKYTLALNPGDAVVEVGTGWGSSSAIFARARDDIEVHTIDDGSNFERYVRKGRDITYREFIEGNLEHFGVLDRVQWHLARSQEIEWKGPIHLLFVDGSHTYGGVKGDIENLLPHVVPDGIVIFHDYPAMKGVKWAVDELMATGDVVVIDRAHSILATRKLDNTVRFTEDPPVPPTKVKHGYSHGEPPERRYLYKRSDPDELCP